MVQQTKYIASRSYCRVGKYSKRNFEVPRLVLGSETATIK
jgi:hypothetical protein